MRCLLSNTSNNNKPGCIVEGYYSSTIPTSKQLCCDTFLVIVFISYLSPSPPPVISTRWLLYNLVKKGRASADVILYVASAKLSNFEFLGFHNNLSIESWIMIFQSLYVILRMLDLNAKRSKWNMSSNSREYLYVVQAMAVGYFSSWFLKSQLL